MSKVIFLWQFPGETNSRDGLELRRFATQFQPTRNRLWIGGGTPRLRTFSDPAFDIFAELHGMKREMKPCCSWGIGSLAWCCSR